MTNFDKLVQIIGPKKARMVVILMSGKKISVGKKTTKVYVEYCKYKKRLDAARPAVAAEFLGCTIRYYKKLRSLTNKIQEKEIAAAK